MRSIIAIIMLSVALLSSNAYANNVQIEGSESDRQVAMLAIEDAYDFFNRHYGVSERFDIKIKFQNEVYYDFSDTDKVRVYGYYPKGSDTLYVTSYDDPWIKERKAFGLPVTVELHRSIIMHEVCHYLLNQYADKKIAGGASEYIAYVAQIESLSDKTRKQVMQLTDKKFRSDMAINFMTYMHSAHVFGVMAYRHYQVGGDYLFPEIISGLFDPDAAIMIL